MDQNLNMIPSICWLVALHTKWDEMMWNHRKNYPKTSWQTYVLDFCWRHTVPANLRIPLLPWHDPEFNSTCIYIYIVQHMFNKFQSLLETFTLLTVSLKRWWFVVHLNSLAAFFAGQERIEGKEKLQSQRVQIVQRNRIIEFQRFYVFRGMV